MAFKDSSQQQDVVRLLQRSLERGRLAHAYLFHGDDLASLEAMARTLAKALNCEHPPKRSAAGLPMDCCDACGNCRKIDGAGHPDVLWIRPESKLRVILVEQIRELLHSVYLKPTQGQFKLAVIVAADRLKTEAANAFLKTLEEPPKNSILVLLSTEPHRILETIVSRCLRLSFGGDGGTALISPALTEWMSQFAAIASAGQRGLLERYQLLSSLIQRLNSIKETITDSQTRLSPLEQYEEIDPKLREKWEKELDASIESEYRRQRSDLVKVLQLWLRDVWMENLEFGQDLLSFPQLAPNSKLVARRITSIGALENLHVLDHLQRQLHSNVQEALAIEVGLLKLHL